METYKDPIQAIYIYNMYLYYVYMKNEMRSASVSE